MSELLTASDAVFDARIAEMLIRDEFPVEDAKLNTAQWKKLRLRLEIRASKLMDFPHSSN